MTDSQRWMVFAAVTVLAVLLYALAPVLTPFLVAALLGYLGDPLVDRLEARKLSRGVSVMLVFCGLFAALLAALLIVLPILQQEIVALVKKTPAYFEWLQATALPWLQAHLAVDLSGFNLDYLKQSLTAHWQQVGGLASGVVDSVSRSGLALMALLANVVLIPVLTFYLLRDWDVIVARVHELIPRRIEPRAVRLARDCDDVLGAFVHGQLMVMISLGTVYAIGLSLVGLDMAVMIGMGAGLVSFVPYLGFVLGIIVAGVAALMQFQDAIHLLYVFAVFAVGQTLESFLLTPYLLGDRIGLHPVAVIFAVMAGGQLFGFVGILLALPMAAVVMVVLRHAHERYVSSDLYAAGQKHKE